jgi:hypothetical protein
MTTLLDKTDVRASAAPRGGKKDGPAILSFPKIWYFSGIFLAGGGEGLSR